MPISATKAAKNKPFIGIDLCTLLSSQGTYALGHGLLTRFQGRPPNLVEGAGIDKSASKPCKNQDIWREFSLPRPQNPYKSRFFVHIGSEG
jgi:hypothetical protein